MEQLKAPQIIRVNSPVLQDAQVALWVQREDAIHERLAGNKWRKLKYNVLDALKAKKTRLVTFGGAYSNHIAATAEAGAIFGLSTIGIIRGERDLSNPTLQKAASLGMQLQYVSRAAYRDKNQLIQELQLESTDSMIIPEGGTNLRALPGCAEIVRSSPLAQQVDYWCVACGTGGTAAGMITALDAKQKLIGFSVLKGNWMEAEIQKCLSLQGDAKKRHKWSVNNEYHFGGYAKFDQRLIDFMNNFKKNQDIPLDPIYTGKLLFGIYDLVAKGYFKPGARIVAIHTGGLQGLAGFQQRNGGLLDY